MSQESQNGVEESVGESVEEEANDQERRETKATEVAYELDKMLTAAAKELGIGLDIEIRKKIDEQLRKLFGVETDEESTR